MTERQWELYRLSVVERWPESPYKAAVIDGIKHKLMILEHQDNTNSSHEKTGFKLSQSVR